MTYFKLYRLICIFFYNSVQIKPKGTHEPCSALELYTAACIVNKKKNHNIKKEKVMHKRFHATMHSQVILSLLFFSSCTLTTNQHTRSSR